jgi:hypothetical protein
MAKIRRRRSTGRQSVAKTGIWQGVIGMYIMSKYIVRNRRLIDRRVLVRLEMFQRIIREGVGYSFL